MSRIVGRIRDGAGPVFVEALTYRWHGHYEGDPQRYRSGEELSQWQAGRDPVAMARGRLTARGAESAALDRVDAEIAARIEAAVTAARAAPEPDLATARACVYAPRLSVAEPEAPGVGEAGGVGVTGGGDAEVFRTMDAVRLGARARARDRS